MKTAINTRTQEEYDALRKYYKSRDISWRSGDKASEFDGWLIHGEDCCVVLNEEGGPCISQGDRGLYEKEGYEIIPFTEFAKANIVEEKSEYRELYPDKTRAEIIDGLQIDKAGMLLMEIEHYKAKYEEAVKLLEWSKQVCANIQRTKTYGTKFPETASLGNAIDDFLNPR